MHSVVGRFWMNALFDPMSGLSFKLKLGYFVLLGWHLFRQTAFKIIHYNTFSFI
jgi:hypothetical protein